MERLLHILLAILCICVALNTAAPVMSYYNISNKPIQPRRPEAKKIIPLPYREPAPVYEEQEDDYYQSRNLIGPSRRPMKYGFVNPKNRRYDARVAYLYNKRFIYSNLVY